MEEKDTEEVEVELRLLEVRSVWDESLSFLREEGRGVCWLCWLLDCMVVVMVL